MSFSLTASANASAGSTTYTGPASNNLNPCAANACVGNYVIISGFTNSVNNGGPWQVSASTSTTLTVGNPSGVAETHAGTALEQATNTYPVAPNWSSTWRVYENELVLCSLAPAHDCYRVVQTRTCPGAQADYWKEAFGSLSRDATLLAYGTDFCQNSTLYYTDMMVISLFSGGGSQIVSGSQFKAGSQIK